MSRVTFNQSEDDSSKIYYYDDKITVTQEMITLGEPYNQVFNLATIQGVSHGKDTSGTFGRLLWCFIAFFGLLFGSILFFKDWHLTGGISVFVSAFILWAAIHNSARPFVELKFGGLNNQMLYFKKMDEAEALSVAIKFAIQSRNTPPNPGQNVYPVPIFPNPVLSRN